MTAQLGSNASLVERLTYGNDVPLDELLDALAHYEELKCTLDGYTVDDCATLADELLEDSTKAQHLDNLLDVCNCGDSLELELEFNELRRFKEVAQAYDIDTPDALGGALQALDDLRATREAANG